jgi:hypothetical protein
MEHWNALEDQEDFCENKEGTHHYLKYEEVMYIHLVVFLYQTQQRWIQRCNLVDLFSCSDTSIWSLYDQRIHPSRDQHQNPDHASLTPNELIINYFKKG